MSREQWKKRAEAGRGRGTGRASPRGRATSHSARVRSASPAPRAALRTPRAFPGFLVRMPRSAPLGRQEGAPAATRPFQSTLPHSSWFVLGLTGTFSSGAFARRRKTETRNPCVALGCACTRKHLPGHSRWVSDITPRYCHSFSLVFHLFTLLCLNRRLRALKSLGQRERQHRTRQGEEESGESAGVSQAGTCTQLPAAPPQGSGGQRKALGGHRRVGWDPTARVGSRQVGGHLVTKSSKC